MAFSLSCCLVLLAKGQFLFVVCFYFISFTRFFFHLSRRRRPDGTRLGAFESRRRLLIFTVIKLAFTTMVAERAREIGCNIVSEGWLVACLALLVVAILVLLLKCYCERINMNEVYV